MTGRRLVKASDKGEEADTCTRCSNELSVGESFTITRNGRPVAELRPVRECAGLSVDKAIAGLRAFRQGRSLGVTSIRELIEGGRRL